MKLMKAMKKLKFWSSKKNKNKKRDKYYKTYQYFQPPYYPTPPPLPPLEEAYHHCQCHFCQPVEPSAPPLPPWLESQLPKTTQEGISGPNWLDPFPGPTQPGGEQPIRTQKPGCTEGRSNSSSSSYQQYLAENPSYDLGLVPNRPQKTATRGLFGCAVNFGSFLFRCFCPCFQISEPL